MKGGFWLPEVGSLLPESGEFTLYNAYWVHNKHFDFKEINTKLETWNIKYCLSWQGTVIILRGLLYKLFTCQWMTSLKP